MSRRVVTTGDGVKLVYQKDKRLNENKLVNIVIPEKLEKKRKQIEQNALQLKKVMFYNGKPLMRTVSYHKRNDGKYNIGSIGTMGMKNYLKQQELLKRPMKFPTPRLFNVEQMKIAEENAIGRPYSGRSPKFIPISPTNLKKARNNNGEPKYMPTSPNYTTKTPVSNEAKYLTTSINACRPHEFLYREFKPSGNKSYFNYLITKNNKNILNIPKQPITKGLIRIGKGAEGVSFMGCLDKDCKKKVAIKVATAAKTNSKQRYQRNWSTSPLVHEFKIQRDVYNKVKSITPHVVVPYAQFICRRGEAFIDWDHPLMKNSVMNTLANGTIKVIDGSERVLVTYTEFYNGGDLWTWLQRHKGISEKNLKAIIFQILWTLKALYEKVPGFIHNDLHTGNIFIRTEGVPTSGKTKYGKFNVPNNGIFPALGDFGWAHSKDRKNPRVMSGLWKNQGIYANKTQRQDIHFLLVSLYEAIGNKYSRTRQFLKMAIGADELLSQNLNNRVKNFRLLQNNNRIKSIDAMLNSEYFVDYRNTGKKVTFKNRLEEIFPLKPAVSANGTKANGTKANKTKPNAPKNKLLNNLKKATMKNSDACGKKAAPKQGGVKAMSVEDMIKFIKKEGTPAAKAAIGSFGSKKPKRAQACGILVSFRAGKKLAGMNVGPNSPAKMPSPKAPSRNTANNNNNNGRPAQQRTIPQLINFIKRYGTMNAKAKLNALKSPLKNRKGVMNIVRSFNKGRNIANVRAVAPKPPSPMKPVLGKMNVPKASKNNATARRATKPNKPTIGKGLKATRNDMRAVEKLATRLWRRQTGNKNYQKARMEASKLYFNKKRDLVKAGLMNTNENLSANLNSIVPPGPKNVAARAAAIRKNVPASVVRKNAGARKVNAKIDMFEYTLDKSNVSTPANVAKALRVNGKKVMQMDRSAINKLLVRVGVDPASIKSKQAAALAIVKARQRYVKPYKTKKQQEEATKKFGNELMKAKNNKEQEQLNKYYKALAARRNAEAKRINAASQKIKLAKNQSPKTKGKLQLFSKLGITK